MGARRAGRRRGSKLGNARPFCASAVARVCPGYALKYGYGDLPRVWAADGGRSAPCALRRLRAPTPLARLTRGATWPTASMPKTDVLMETHTILEQSKLTVTRHST